ncbi:MAG: PAS domain-containing protein [Deltaproteobacteria bacterium]|nr:PAS domain-containing protein [Deltaproteobacteria bacterium]
MDLTRWVDEFEGAVTVCDTEGVILALNRRAEQMFVQDGGAALIGKSLFDCHPEHANDTIRRLLADRSSNVYTVEKRGVRKLIYQAPWYRDGEFSGLLELTFDLPTEMRNIVRD